MITKNTLGFPDNKPFSDFLEEFSKYTLAALEDELLKSFLSSEKNERFYYAQAEFYLRRINVYDPLPIFVLYIEDIPDGLTRELSTLDKETKDQIITNVVRRIYKSVDKDYFHTNGIYAKVKWFTMETSK